MPDRGSALASPQQLRAFRTGFERAASAAGGLIRAPFRVAGERVVLEFASVALMSRIARPFAHLRCEDGPAALRIRVWDSESTGVPLPPELPSPGSVYAQSLPSTVEEHSVRWAFFRPDPGLTAYDAASREADYWIPAVSRITYGDLAGGFRAVFAWDMAQQGLQFLHAAAVADGGRAGLIVGRSGSGKSSTSLACLLAGMEFLGDDHCLLDLRGTPAVHSIYAAAKLHTSQLERFPDVERLVINPDREPPIKGVALLHPEFAGLLPASRPLAAVFVPQISGGPATAIEPIGPAAALAALAPSTLLQTAAADRGALAAMAKLVRSVPCFRLSLGTERSEIAGRIRTFLREQVPCPAP